MSARSNWLLADWLVVARLCRCLNSGNRSLAEGESKMDVFRRYRFCIAMENTVAHDYVTEKLWDAFAAGCVPIYYVRKPP